MIPVVMDIITRQQQEVWPSETQPYRNEATFAVHKYHKQTPLPPTPPHINRVA